MMSFSYQKLKQKETFLVIGGPCAIESKEQLFQTAKQIKGQIDILRGGAFKPRTSPDSFQGLGEEGLKLLKQAGKLIDKPTITEVMEPDKVELVAKYSGILQIGARNMQNYPLLTRVGSIDKPVMLKRGLSATIDEWLAAVKYVTSEGNKKVILCERGIRTFETKTRFTLDLAGALKAKRISSLPVIIDPSHATGDKELIEPMVKAAKAAGFDGVMVETHNNPEEALCDKDQALTTSNFNKIFDRL
jgi:3-deoxy-7-phosphoheptulonate synthase